MAATNIKTSNITMRPIRIFSGAKRDVRTQFAALCFRVRNKKVQFLLVTSRNTGRWVVPKGWPMDNMTPQDAALQEAWEEAGVKGKVVGNTVGIYSYAKQLGEEKLPCVVALFPVKVQSLAKTFPESAQRKRKWATGKKAAALLDEPELAQIVRNFSP